MEKIGFIGLGKMGFWMAKNLIEAGFPLMVYDLNKSAVKDLVKIGAEAAVSSKEVASKVEIVLIVTPPLTVNEVLCAPEGVLNGCSEGKIVINCANSNPEDDITYARWCAEKKAEFIDAGISGAPEGAKEATLAFMVGGNRAVYDKVCNVLLAMGSVVDYFGPVGSGRLVKTINNMLVIMNMVCAAEAINFAQRCGLDEKMVLRVLTKGLANSKMLEHARNYYEKDPADRSTDQSRITKQGKGNYINWAQDIAREKGIYLPMAALANEAFTNASEDKGPTRYDQNIDILKGIRWQAMVASAEDKA